MKEQLSVSTMLGGAVLLFAFLGVSLMIWRFFQNVGWHILLSVEGTRPVIAIAAIMATLTYGGGLLFSALFSSDGKFEDRFRMAREIFLVFSGVFATIVGFHFGQSTSAAPSSSVSDRPSVAVTGREGAIELQISGGSPPYHVRARGDIKEIDRPGVDQQVTIEIEPANQGQLVNSVTLSVTDSRKKELMIKTYNAAALAGTGYKAKSGS